MKLRSARFARTLAILTAVASTCPTCDASAIVLSKSNDHTLAAKLASLETLADEELDSGLHVRLYRTWDAGECDPGAEASTCPRTQLLVVNSMDIEGQRESVLWQSEHLFQWQLIGNVSKDPSSHQTPDEVAFGVFSFELSVCRAPASVESAKVDPRKGGWWKEVHYRVRLSRQRLTIVETPSADSGRICELH